MAYLIAGATYCRIPAERRWGFAGGAGPKLR
jgi:hypothetical protein